MQQEETQETLAAYKQTIEQLEASNKAAEENMKKTMTAKLAEIEAAIREEKARVVEELVSERDRTVREAEATYAGKLNDVQAEAFKWFESLQKQTAELIEVAKKSTETEAQRREVRSVLHWWMHPAHVSLKIAFEKEIASLIARLEGVRVSTVSVYAASTNPH